MKTYAEKMSPIAIMKLFLLLAVGTGAGLFSLQLAVFVVAEPAPAALAVLTAAFAGMWYCFAHARESIEANRRSREIRTPYLSPDFAACGTATTEDQTEAAGEHEEYQEPLSLKL